MTRTPLYLNGCGIVTSLGRGKSENARAIFAGENGIAKDGTASFGRDLFVGAVRGCLAALPERLSDIDCRNNRLMRVALDEVAPLIESMITRYGKHRVAVVVGSSTGGMSDGENALEQFQQTGAWPTGFDYHNQEMSGLGNFTARYFGITGPAITISTACSSSSKVFAAARRMIEAGLVDAAIVGGADTLCRMTLDGFNALELLSPAPCLPFSRNRQGITIGEGACAFLMSRDEGSVAFLGAGETSDAYHPTAPQPEGLGAQAAMRQALDDAGWQAADIAYVNLHGTASVLNDAMEAHAVSNVFGSGIPCGSTKGLTGHMLGATGGCEAAFLWLTLHPTFNPQGFLPRHAWDGDADPALPQLNLVTAQTRLPETAALAMLSNSFGFGGSNAAVVLGARK